ncbi:FBD-associated F-box protein At4g10400-like [Gastrolobium bilobum]|uniref:FBD-associated F-box protein At4g10400-like n=1 Tax=Gastrolobium bilobum TaxID=150636 RepID=UPI002AAF385E|nr:FBD-associated F-box protein At4g10400-like [Gastrolobium bilobum]
MADRISNLPDEFLCYILCFMSTKQAVATCVLSKRWKLLWRSVPTLDFDDTGRFSYNKDMYSGFVRFVYAIMLSRVSHSLQPIQNFHLKCCSSYCDPSDVNAWVNAALQRRVEHISLFTPRQVVPSAIFSHRPLVVLKLTGLTVKALSSVDFPALKVLYLRQVTFLKLGFLVELLSGCPVLEDLVAMGLCFKNSLIEGEFKRLPKLVRIYTCKPLFEKLRATVNDVEFLHIYGMDAVNNFKEMNMFHKLTHVELTYYKHTRDWREVVEFLKHCPKLQILVINKVLLGGYKEEEGDVLYPQSVPESISSHLKTCCFNNYHGLTAEFRFARYIMQYARILRTMKICVDSTTANLQAKHEMLKNLSLCSRLSTTCKLSFK